MEVQTAIPDAEAASESHPETPALPSRYIRYRNWIILTVSLAIIPLAFALQVVDGDRVAFRFLPQMLLPDICFSQIFFGADCPGCGLTRSFISLARGQFSTAWHHHRLGWLIAVIALVQIPYRIISLKTQRALPSRAGRWISWSLITLLTVDWTCRLAGW